MVPDVISRYFDFDAKGDVDSITALFTGDFPGGTVVLKQDFTVMEEGCGGFATTMRRINT